MSDPILSREELVHAARAILMAVLGAPHDIERASVTVHFDDSKPGHNALNQMSGRIEAELAAVLEKVCGEPAGWLHVMHMEGGQTQTRLTEDAEDHFGVPGEDYSEEYVVTSEPLFALTRNKP